MTPEILIPAPTSLLADIAKGVDLSKVLQHCFDALEAYPHLSSKLPGNWKPPSQLTDDQVTKDVAWLHKNITQQQKDLLDALRIHDIRHISERSPAYAKHVSKCRQHKARVSRMRATYAPANIIDSL
jgi:hypothetical protein